MENRIRKLANEELRLQKQIGIANSHTKFAADVQKRRIRSYVQKAAHREQVEATREAAVVKHKMRKEENKINIVNHKKAILHVALENKLDVIGER